MQSDITLGQMNLTLDNIRGIVSDYTAYRLGSELVSEEKIGFAGASGEVIWAAFPETSRRETHTAFSFSNLRAACTCGAARFPCRHIIALMINNAASTLGEADPPDWVIDLLGQSEGEISRENFNDNRIFAAVNEGIAELDLRIGDLMRQGLASLKNRKANRYWIEIANRMANCFLPQIAGEIRELAVIPTDTSTWPEQLLPRIGRLALLVEGFKQFENLPFEMRGDLVTAAGLTRSAGTEEVLDRWLVAGRQQVVADRVRRTTTWLFGQESHRWAILPEKMIARFARGFFYPVGAQLMGRLRFELGSRPLQAYVHDHLTFIDSFPAVNPTGNSIDAAIRDYATALALNPWLLGCPYVLENVWAEPVRGKWRLRDRSGSILPLPDRFPYGWQLLAKSAGKATTLFGEWNGQTFAPLSIYDGSWHNLLAWRGNS